MAEYKVHHFTTRDSNDRWQIVDKVGREYVAKQFNVNYSYEINEYCIYNNALYKFIQNHNAGIWNNQHVILCANLASELTSIKNDINNSNNNINTLSGEITNIQNEVRSSISDVMDRVDDAKDEIEDDVRDSINVMVTDWLDLHVNTDEGQTSIVDDTLTIQGAAADAKAAGDAISALSGGLNNIQTGTSTDIGKALSPKTVSNNKVTEWQYVSVGGGGGGTTDYSALSNKPSINDVTLSGNKTAADLGLGTYSKPSGGIPASDIASGVIPVIDATLSNTGEAADAKATGDALALKANKVQLKDVVTGTCSTGASTAKKVVVLDDANANIGSNPTIIVYFSNGNSANTPTIQIGATGIAYPVYYQSNNSGDLTQMNTNEMYSHWGAGIHVFRYSSGKWIAGYPDMYHIKTLFSYISSKAGTASPTFTGTPNAPTASTGTDTTQIATTAFVQQEISAQSISATVTDGNLTLSMGVVNNG